MGLGTISSAVFGLIAGILGSKTLDERGDGFPLNISVGIVGAVMGGLVFDLIGASGVIALNFWSMIVTMMGPRTLCC